MDAERTTSINNLFRYPRDVIYAHNVACSFKIRSYVYYWRVILSVLRGYNISFPVNMTAFFSAQSSNTALWYTISTYRREGVLFSYGVTKSG